MAKQTLKLSKDTMKGLSAEFGRGTSLYLSPETDYLSSQTDWGEGKANKSDIYTLLQEKYLDPIFRDQELRNALEHERKYPDNELSRNSTYNGNFSHNLGNNEVIGYGNSRVVNNREYLMNSQIASKFNRYESFMPFQMFSDQYASEYEFVEDTTPPATQTGQSTDNKTQTEEKKAAESSQNQSTTPKNPDETKGMWQEKWTIGDTKEYRRLNPMLGVKSLFNKATAITIGRDLPVGVKVDSKNSSTIRKAQMKVQEQYLYDSVSDWRSGLNAPLTDGAATRKKMKHYNDCTIKSLVDASARGHLGRNMFSYSDFMYCKYLGRLSNNHLITLRRFSYPVDDYISSAGIGKGRKRKHAQSKNASSVGCMVTWFGTPGNNLEDILKYSVAMPFQEKSAKLEDSQVDADSGPGGIFNAMAAMMDGTYMKQYSEGKSGTLVNKYANQILGHNALGDPPYTAKDYNNFRDSNKAYGPIDRTKTTHIRGEDGLKFDMSFSLTFDYELRAYNGINGKQAMLDLVSHILAVVYQTGSFWGGGYRGGGAHQNNVFTNLNIFKGKNQTFTDYVNAFANDFQTLKARAANTAFGKAITNISEGNVKEGIMDAVNALLGALNKLGGMLISGALNTLGRPQKVMLNSALTAAPVGFWHVTIGNPKAPIMSIGNLIIKNATINHYGPLGLDDFPTGLKVVVELNRGKSRDIREIEKLYTGGNDRIYASMGPKIFDMYKNAKMAYEGNTEKISPNSSYIYSEDYENTVGYVESGMNSDQLKNHLGPELYEQYQQYLNPDAPNQSETQPGGPDIDGNYVVEMGPVVNKPESAQAVGKRYDADIAAADEKYTDLIKTAPDSERTAYISLRETVLTQLKKQKTSAIEEAQKKEQEYKEKNKSNENTDKYSITTSRNDATASTIKFASALELKRFLNLMEEEFGTRDMESIRVFASEMEWGAGKHQHEPDATTPPNSANLQAIDQSGNETKAKEGQKTSTTGDQGKGNGQKPTTTAKK